MTNTQKYIASKVAHLKRTGMVTGSSTGIGQSGGAAPDWLITLQRQRQEEYAKRRAAQR